MTTRHVELARRFGPAMLTTLASQGVSAVALLSIVLLGSRISDSYALAIQVGLSSFSGVVLQVLYFVAIGRPWMQAWTLWSWLSAVFSVLFAGGVVGVAAAKDGITMQHAILLGIFGIGGAFLGPAGVIGVRFACHGKPLIMVGITIAPNIALAVGSVAVRETGTASGAGAYLPGVLWAIASLGVWLACRRRPLPGLEVRNAWVIDGGRAQTIHAVTLSIGLIGNTIYPSLFLAALHQLDDGSTTVLFLVSRIGTSLVGLFVNAVLAVRFNWTSAVARTGPIALWFAVAAVFAGAAALVAHGAGLIVASYLLTLVCWFFAIIAAPLVLREINARRMVLANSVKTAVDLLFVLTVGTWFLATPSVSGFFGIYVVLQAATLVTCALALRYRATALVSLLLLAIGLAQVLLAW